MKICIAHFRAGLTDGVSLQINERVRILENLGHKVYVVADLKSPIADLQIPYLSYKENLKVQQIQTEAFSGGFNDESMRLLEKIAFEVEKELDEFWNNHYFSLIFVHNIFALPVDLPVTIAFYNFLKRHPQIKCISVNHDFWWDPPRESLFKSDNPDVVNILTKYFPPKLPNITNTVLSKWEYDKLYKIKGIKADIVTDTFDFNQALWQQNETNKDFLKDVGIAEDEMTILLASRIRPRKGIELGIDFVKYLNDKLNGKKAVLLLPNDFTAKETAYIDLLKKKAKDLNVKVVWAQDLVGSEEEKTLGIKKYSLWDSYVFADAVIYPSLWEGFGNQFLEAVFAKKPVITYEYPVFETDIKPAGFKVINIGKAVVIDENGLATIEKEKFENAASNLIKILNDRDDLAKVVATNFNIGKRKFNTRVQLRKYLYANSEKFLIKNGIKTIVSPYILSGKLIASGVRAGEAYDLAELIIDEIPDKGLGNDSFFQLVCRKLPTEIKNRYVTLEMMSDFLKSDKAKSPLFIFIGGLAGKTSLSNVIVDNLGVNQPLAFDNEKFRIADPDKSKSFLWKATYESSEGYIKTVEAMYPYMLSILDRLYFDYKRYKKWCYLLEGIYLSSEIIKKLNNNHKDIYLLSVFVLPRFGEIKKRYVLRWQEELGIEKLKVRKNIIDKYLNNVGAIRMHIKKNLDPVASFVIESPVLEERMSSFYAILYQKLKSIADAEIPGWMEKISRNPSLVKEFKTFLNE